MSRSRFRATYGAGLVNLLVLLLSFVIAGFAVVGWFQRPRDVTTVIEWFAAAIVLHDLVAVPLYTLLDRIVLGWLGRGLAGVRGRRVIGVVGSTPYLRVPAILSGLLLVVFFPVIFGLGSQAELSASGIAEKGYLARWLIASGVMFGLSGVAWGVAAGRGRKRRDGAGAAPVAAAAPAAVPAVAAAAAPAAAPTPEPTPDPTTPNSAPPAAPAPIDVGEPPSTPAPERPAPSNDATVPPPPE